MRRVQLRDGDLRLRPFVEGDLDALVAGRGVGAAGPPQNEDEARRSLRVRIERSGRFVDGRLDLGIELDGRLVGSLDARQPRNGLPPGVYELGIGLFDEQDRGRGVGARAVTLLVDHLFADERTERVQASTWTENAAMRRVLEKLGFRVEGVMRAFMPAPEGGRHDYALYAVTRSDWLGRPDQTLR